MLLCKRIIASLALLVAATALLLGLIAGVGVWVVKKPVTTRVTHVYGRVDAALDVAEQSLDQAQTTLATAAERLETVKEDRRQLAQQAQPRRGDLTRRLVAQQVQRMVAPEFSNAHETLDKVAGAAVVVNSVLDDLGNFPFLATTGLDTDRLAELNGALAQVGPAAWELSRVLGQPEEPLSAADTPLSRIEQTLKLLRAWIAEYKSQVREVRQQTTEIKTRALAWITPAAILVSFAGFWIALSQISVMTHAWSWLKRPRQNNLPPG
jgi:F0F1-type ATP synthase membrane subunit b/b'